MPATRVSEPLAIVRRLYDAWNAGDVARAAELLAPDVQWETFRADRPLSGPGALQATLAGPSGGTWRLTRVDVDLLVAIRHHVIAFSRRGGVLGEPETDRVEVWTLDAGKAVHYRGYPLEAGLAILSDTTRSHKLEAVCRALLAFNRDDAAGWLRFFTHDAELAVPGLNATADGLAGRRIDDVQILAEGFSSLVLSAMVEDSGGRTPLNLVISFTAQRTRRIVAHATPDEALAAAARARP